MRRDLTHRPPLHFSGCVASPSCFPVHHEEYSRIQHVNNDVVVVNRLRRKWRNLVRRLVRESKISIGSKRLTFQYDAVSYSQNFDEGCRKEEEEEEDSGKYCSMNNSRRDLKWGTTVSYLRK
ncbi:hypothetical protein BVC80_5g25 [Macleaya cordata]|uniref:Uncharacterized protein n=1 Tax=Macleaya cordata TaxID=56857 RepID=A0A200QXW4_MACCD|nr:hypothetical protein BVC80_5g25 [Macleaya cordata]